VAAPTRYQLFHQGIERRGQHDRAVPEQDLRLVAVALNVVNGEVANGVDVLGVEQQEQARDPVSSRRGVIMQEPTCDLPPRS
jgi:hypothetical protein